MRRTAGRRGFTLIELVITMAVVAILTTIAVASYSAYVLRGQRAAAKTALLQDAQFMERNYTVTGTYANLPPPAGQTVGPPVTSAALPVQQAPQEGTVAYSIQIQVATTATSSTYLLSAQPQANINDPTCGTFTLDNTGAKALNINGSVVNDAQSIQTCWQR